tara:strand:+ start:11165 stop:12001 length:837 start_codon:yes stop_codon:yes gene_type:complete
VSKPEAAVKILVVEDESMVRELTIEILEDPNFQFYEAENGLEAIQCLNSNDIDLILTDMTMPKMSGQQLIEHLHRENFKIPVIVITAYSSFVEDEAFKYEFVKGYYGKPINFELLKRRIQDVTDHTEATQEFGNVDGLKNKRAKLGYLEDDDNDFNFFYNSLTKQNLDQFVEVIRFNTGEELLKAVDDGQQMDIFLLDYHLPKLTGLEVLKSLKENQMAQNVPKIMLTALHGEEEMRQCYAAGASSFVVKPWDLEDWDNINTSLKNFWLPQIAGSIMD